MCEENLFQERLFPVIVQDARTTRSVEAALSELYTKGIGFPEFETYDYGTRRRILDTHKYFILNTCMAGGYTMPVDEIGGTDAVRTIKSMDLGSIEFVIPLTFLLYNIRFTGDERQSVENICERLNKAIDTMRSTLADQNCLFSIDAENKTKLIDCIQNNVKTLFIYPTPDDANAIYNSTRRIMKQIGLSCAADWLDENESCLTEYLLEDIDFDKKSVNDKSFGDMSKRFSSSVVFVNVLNGILDASGMYDNLESLFLQSSDRSDFSYRLRVEICKVWNNVTEETRAMFQKGIRQILRVSPSNEISMRPMNRTYVLRDVEWDTRKIDILYSELDNVFGLPKESERDDRYDRDSRYNAPAYAQQPQFAPTGTGVRDFANGVYTKATPTRQAGVMMRDRYTGSSMSALANMRNRIDSYKMHTVNGDEGGNQNIRSGNYAYDSRGRNIGTANFKDTGYNTRSVVNRDYSKGSAEYKLEKPERGKNDYD